jgi:hypothetical protein
MEGKAARQEGSSEAKRQFRERYPARGEHVAPIGPGVARQMMGGDRDYLASLPLISPFRRRAESTTQRPRENRVRSAPARRGNVNHLRRRT